MLIGRRLLRRDRRRHAFLAGQHEAAGGSLDLQQRVLDVVHFQQHFQRVPVPLVGHRQFAEIDIGDGEQHQDDGDDQAEAGGEFGFDAQVFDHGDSDAGGRIGAMYHLVGRAANKKGPLESGPAAIGRALRAPGVTRVGDVCRVASYLLRFSRAIAAMRMRSALSLMKPPASAWLYAPPSSSKVAMFISNSESVLESRETTITLPL